MEVPVKRSTSSVSTKEVTLSSRQPTVVDHPTNGAIRVSTVTKTRRARRSRRTKNSTADSNKRKGMASSLAGCRKEPQKNSSRTSCSSAPLPRSSSHNQSLMTVAQSLGGPSPLRPRSLYTTHTYRNRPEETAFRPPSWPHLEAAAELGKYLDQPPADQWSTSQQLSRAGYPAGIPAALWRQQQQPQPQPAPPHRSSSRSQFYGGEGAGAYADGWREHESEASLAGAVTTSHGTISLRLHNKIRLDMTIDRAIRLVNFKNNIVLSLNGSGSASALLHPNGRIYQYGSRVEILAHDAHGNNKYAKMWYKGVSFTSEQCALVYLVDAAGARTTTDSFSDMSQDFSVNVFYAESRHGPAYIHEAAVALSTAQFWITDEGVENWIINNVRISQTPDGLVRIARNSNKYQLRTSPSNGTASLTTPFLHCTASLGQTPHLFVRRGERRMHYDGTSFIVRNAGHSAGFDDNNQLKVY